jgi:hypothetical protein
VLSTPPVPVLPAPPVPVLPAPPTPVLLLIPVLLVPAPPLPVGSAEPQALIAVDTRGSMVKKAKRRSEVFTEPPEIAAATGLASDHEDIS